MKKRYYIRGIGIGVAVTVVIMHFALGDEKQPMTDAEIKERAAELGMMESSLLSEYENSVSDASANAISENQVSPSVSVNETASAPTAAIVSATPATTTTTVTAETSATEEMSEPSAQSSTTPSSTPSDIIMITVESGDSSYSVAKKLYDAGLVDSAAEYDEFLCSNGFDKTISVGSHPIPAGSTNWEIAELITTKQ